MGETSLQTLSASYCEDARGGCHSQRGSGKSNDSYGLRNPNSAGLFKHSLLLLYLQELGIGASQVYQPKEQNTL